MGNKRNSVKGTEVKAVFNGKDNGGYIPGKEYTLNVWQHSELGFNKIAVELAEKPDENYIEYDNVVLFLNDWGHIKPTKTLFKKIKKSLA